MPTESDFTRTLSPLHRAQILAYGADDAREDLAASRRLNCVLSFLVVVESIALLLR